MATRPTRERDCVPVAREFDRKIRIATGVGAARLLSREETMTVAKLIERLPHVSSDSRHRNVPSRRESRGTGRAAPRYVLLESPIGWVLVAATDHGVSAVRLGDDAAGLEVEMRSTCPDARRAAEGDAVTRWAREIARHLEGETTRVDVPLDLTATPFQRRVWAALRAIPRGDTRTYAEVAEAVGARGAARAVARACATNPVALVVPCHRVIRADGDLAGYRWGLARKTALLERERRQADQAEAAVLRGLVAAADEDTDSRAAPAGAPKPGEVIAERYELRRHLGSGGMGMVYQAYDRVLDETVALKLLRPGAVAAPDALARVVEEVRLMRRITHPNVVRTHDVGIAGEDRFLVMEYVEGRSLAGVLAGRGRVPVASALVVGVQLARALDAVHARGILHRDVKPENILLTGAGQLKLGDFGVSVLCEVGGSERPAHRVFGTPPYMAPELLMGEPADVRADVFAAGAVLHQALTGVLPFEGSTPTALAAAMLREDPLPIAKDRAVPPRLAALVSAALAADPERRPPTAAALQEALAGVTG